MTLRTDDHDRGSAGLEHVYPVVSRRSGGVSVGVNLNTNAACNWRCIYCQVPGLARGKAPEIDLGRLGDELRRFLGGIAHGDWLARNAPDGARRLADVAFSGDGEPTSSPQFAEAVALVCEVLDELGLGRTKLVLITNGSLVHRASVRAGLELFRPGDEVWFKLDSATDEGMRAINDVAPGMARVRTNLRTASSLVPTWIQTCVFARRGEPPSEDEQRALVELVAEELDAGTPLLGMLLYGLARPSHQPEAAELSALPREWIEAFAERVRATGLAVRSFP